MACCYLVNKWTMAGSEWELIDFSTWLHACNLIVFSNNIRLEETETYLFNTQRWQWQWIDCSGVDLLKSMLLSCCVLWTGCCSVYGSLVLSGHVHHLLTSITICDALQLAYHMLSCKPWPPTSCLHDLNETYMSCLQCKTV